MILQSEMQGTLELALWVKDLSSETYHPHTKLGVAGNTPRRTQKDFWGVQPVSLDKQATGKKCKKKKKSSNGEI